MTSSHTPRIGIAPPNLDDANSWYTQMSRAGGLVEGVYLVTAGRG